MTLKPVSFVYNNDDSEDATKHIGFVAQDVREQPGHCGPLFGG